MPMTISRFLFILVISFAAVCSFATAEPSPARLEASGIEAMGQGHYEQAASVFRELIELRPGSFVGHYNLGAALSMQGDGQGAVGDVASDSARVY